MVQVHYSMTGEGSLQEPRPVSLLGIDGGVYFRCAMRSPVARHAHSCRVPQLVHTRFWTCLSCTCCIVKSSANLAFVVSAIRTGLLQPQSLAWHSPGPVP